MKNRRGLTLVEMLVVIVIIGMLVGMIMPAVQSARESARRTACANGIRQIGLAMQAYHSSNGAFPSGIVLSKELVADGNAYGGLLDWRFNKGSPAWGAMILPFLEQTDVFNRLAFTQATFTRTQNPGPPLQSVQSPAIVSSPTAASAQPLAVYACASDTLKQTELASDMGPSNYAGNYGVPPAYVLNGVAGQRTGAPLPNRSGVLYHGSAITVAHIRDGTSMTFLIGEISTQQRAWPLYAAGKGSQGAGVWPAVADLKADDLVLRQCDASHPINSQLSDDQIINGYSGWADCDGFGSRHPGGANFVMCDSSVRFISENIESSTSPLGTYQRLSHRNDGLAISGEY